MCDRNCLARLNSNIHCSPIGAQLGLDSGDKRYNVTRSATGSECAHVEFEFGIARNCRRGNPAAADPNRARRPQYPATAANWAHAPTRRATTVQSGTVLIHSRLNLILLIRWPCIAIFSRRCFLLYSPIRGCSCHRHGQSLGTRLTFVALGGIILGPNWPLFSRSRISTSNLTKNMTR